MKTLLFNLVLTFTFELLVIGNLETTSILHSRLKDFPSILSSSDFVGADPYELMNSVFIGNPEISEIKPLVEGVLKKYSLSATDEYRLKVGSMLVSLRKHNEGKITEMELLKHIYQHGSNRISLPDQAGFSATILLND